MVVVCEHRKEIGENPNKYIGISRNKWNELREKNSKNSLHNAHEGYNR